MSAAIACVIDARGDARAITLADHTGLLADETTIETRPDVDGLTAVTIEHWIGGDYACGPARWSATQLRAAAAVLVAAAEEAERRS